MPRPTAVLCLALATAALTACSGSSADVADRTAAPSPVATAASVLSPGPTPPPAPTALAQVPAAGTVSLRPGPFDDRFALVGTRLERDGVHTALTITSDVSELLALELTADFYDARGGLLGSGSTTAADEHGGEEEVHTGPEARELHVPTASAWSARVTSAVLSVPVLVNE